MPLRVLSLVAGVLLVVGTSTSVIATLVVPRGIGSRISKVVGRRLVRGSFLFVARRFDEYETKDRILALAAPVALLTTFAVWLVLYLLAYGLVIWGLVAGSFAHALRESGSSLFTLGVAASPDPAPT